jgi:hypothetical protein
MGRERSGNVETEVLRGSIAGALLIALIGGLLAWTGFIVADRLHKMDAARRLEGSWNLAEGGGFRFEFGHGYRGTIAVRGAGAESTERARIAWRRSSEAVVAVGPGEAHEDFYLIRFTPNPDAVSIQAEGTDTPELQLRRHRRSP